MPKGRDTSVPNSCKPAILLYIMLVNFEDLRLQGKINVMYTELYAKFSALSHGILRNAIAPTSSQGEKCVTLCPKNAFFKGVFKLYSLNDFERRIPRMY